MDVRTVFTSAGTVYAGTSAGLFKSEGAGGFQPVAQGPEADPKSPQKLNQAAQTAFTGVAGQMLAGVASGGVYKSTDGGAEVGQTLEVLSHGSWTGTQTIEFEYQWQD